MFTLNPLDNPDALWQYIIMIVGAVVIGYFIGDIDGRKKQKGLEKKLNKLTNDLDRCQSQKLKEVPTKEASRVAVATTPTVKNDNLQIVEGIGPVIEELLNSEGIYSFVQLAETKPDQLTRILQNADNRLLVHDPRTWPQQAKLAAFEMWDDLKELQNELNKGRHES
jgi:predicted flap endonuclease-1-like 5' DNA nuclease